MLLATLLVATGCGDEQDKQASGEPSRLHATLEETLTLGAEQDRPLEELFSSPRFVATSGDRIYVADQKENRIKVFGAQGQFQRVIGSQGQGPGEFQRIIAMAVDDDGTVLIADQQNGRITRLSPEGEVLDSHPLTVSPRLIAPLESGYLLGFRGERDSLFHLYDSTFAEETSTFGALSNHGNAEEPFWRLSHGFDPGDVALSQNGNAFVYTPRLYGGKLYRYEKRNGQWQLDQPWPGHSTSEKAYELIDREPPEGTMWQKTYHRDEQYTALLNAVTEGVFQLQDGRVIHITRRAIGDDHPLYLEVFDKSGRLTGHRRLQWADTSSSKASLNSLRIRVAAKDEEDRFYLIDGTELPVVRAARLHIEQLTGEGE